MTRRCCAGRGLPWGGSDDYREDVAGIVKALKLKQGRRCTRLRHSSIVRALLRGLPIRLVAASTTPACGRSRRTYSKSILDHSDDISPPPCCIMSRSPINSSPWCADRGCEAQAQACRRAAARRRYELAQTAKGASNPT